MKKVLIVTIPKQEVTRPPGIQSILAACCELVEHDYEIFDVNLQMHKEYPSDLVTKLNADFFVNRFENSSHRDAYISVCSQLAEKIKQYQPDWVAISVFTNRSLLAADELLKLLHSTTERSNYKIVIGGVGVGDAEKNITGVEPFGSYCKKTQLVDHVIYGEGELSFVELLKGNFNYPGIDNNSPKQILDLDALPRPSYKKIDPGKYIYTRTPEILVTGSRGCVRSCTFCDVASIWNRYVYKSGTTMAEELFEIWKQTGVLSFEFSDSLLNGSIKSFREFNRRLIELRKENPGFTPLYKGQFICRPKNQLKAIDYDEMKLAGVETLMVGVEQFSEKVRYDMKKNFDNDSLDWHLSQCARLNIKNGILLMSGYVTETAEDHQLMLDGLVKYQKYALTRIIDSIGLSVSGLAITVGSPMYELREELEVEMSGEFEWISLKNPTLTRKERLRRATEVFYVGAKLGYQMLHFDERMATIRRILNEVKNSTAREAIPIAKI